MNDLSRQPLAGTLPSHQPKLEFSWVRESPFGRWFQNSNTWFRYVVIEAIADFKTLLGGREPGGQILDLGCGHGLTFALLNDAFQPDRITAIDIDTAMLKAAVKRAETAGCPVDVRHGCATGIDALDAQFDMILCHQLLHHCSDQEKVLSEMLRVLKPGGVALIGETCSTFIRMLPIRVLFTHPMSAQKSGTQYVQLVRDCGFDVADEQCVHYTPWWSVPDLGLIDRFRGPDHRIDHTEVMMIARKPKS